MRPDDHPTGLRTIASSHAGVLALLDALHSAGVLYCHFKSNEHVAAGIRGETDLDILIDRGIHDKAQTLLVNSGFKMFPSEPLAGYPAVEDWIGLDPHTGKLAHLHVHWQMVAGEPHLKGYRIPWERRILEGRIWHGDSAIFTASTEMELLLLVARAALKFRLRSHLKALLGRPAWTADFQREHLWLLERADEARLAELAQSLLSEPLATQIVQFAMSSNQDKRDFASLRRSLVRHFSSWRSFSPLHARMTRWKREMWRRMIVRVLRRSGKLPLSRRAPATGGLIVALVGADGSGKTTQTEALARWLGWKIDVCRVYFGSGDGPVSWHRSTLRWLRGVLRGGKGAGIKARALQAGAKTESPGTFRRIFQGLYAISRAVEKRSVATEAIRARNRGMIVVCDRYPQNQIAGYNDGPLLTQWSGSGFPWSFLAHWEQRLLSVFSKVSPDLVIKLNVSEDVSAARKSDTPREMIGKKIAAVRAIDFGPECQVIELDADRSIREVTQSVRRAVWQFL